MKEKLEAFAGMPVEPLESRLALSTEVVLIRLGAIAKESPTIQNITSEVGMPLPVVTPPELSSETILDWLELNPIIIREVGHQIQVVGNVAGYRLALDQLAQHDLIPVRVFLGRAGKRLDRILFCEAVVDPIISRSGKATARWISKAWRWFLTSRSSSVDSRALGCGATDYSIAKFLRVNRNQVR